MEHSGSSGAGAEHRCRTSRAGWRSSPAVARGWARPRPGSWPAGEPACVVADVDDAGGAATVAQCEARGVEAALRPHRRDASRTTWPPRSPAAVDTLGPARRRDQQRRHDRPDEADGRLHARASGTASSRSTSTACSSGCSHEIPQMVAAGRWRDREHVVGRRARRLRRAAGATSRASTACSGSRKAAALEYVQGGRARQRGLPRQHAHADARGVHGAATRDREGDGAVGADRAARASGGDRRGDGVAAAPTRRRSSSATRSPSTAARVIVADPADHPGACSLRAGIPGPRAFARWRAPSAPRRLDLVADHRRRSAASPSISTGSCLLMWPISPL